MRTKFEDVYSDGYHTIVPTMSDTPFRLGLPIRRNSPPLSFNGLAHRPNVFDSQSERITAGTSTAYENRDAELPSIPYDPQRDDSKVTVTAHKSEDEEIEILPIMTRRRARAVEVPNRPAQTPTLWPKHMFRLVEKCGHRYYDVRGDAVGSTPHKNDLKLSV